MPKWRKEIRLKDLLTDDDTPGNVKLVAGEVVDRLREQPEYGEFSQLYGIVQDFEALAAEPAPSCHHFNGLLGELYDWADAERVWVA